ncbi:MAG TPA: condensation domain-containing protein, partial [Candidatus Eisenbacteria bacterium]|nr:condensation domain-containing protein [Candidatus Eisenbacteria bacterium]
AAEPTLNTAGWTSSFTGEPIPAEHMREWAETTVQRIRALRPRRVLEIGCGTGMLLTRLAGDCDEYVASDISERAVRGLREVLRREGDRYRRVRLLTAEAADLGALDGATFDTVVINSVVQYFPDAGYLVDVLERAVAAVRPGGHVFVGDVRSLPLLEAFHAAVALHRASPGTAVAEVLRAVDEGVAQENELVVDPRLFTRLAETHPRITGVTVRPRAGRMANEMTGFRYVVVLDVERPVAPPASRLRTVPNARVALEVRALELLRSAPGESTIDGVRAEPGSTTATGADPDDECVPAECLAPAIDADWSAGRPDGSFDVVVRAGGAVPASGPHPEPAPVTDWSLYANDPLRTSANGNLGPELRRFLAGKLPAYEVPVVVLELDRMPLSSNGKVDRSALPEPVATAIRQGQEFVALRNERERALAEIWSELLGIEAVGALSSFFELGGDSLRAARLVVRAAEAGLQLTVGQIFETPVLADLAAAAAPAPDGQAAPAAAGGAGLPALGPPDLRSRFHPFPLMPIQQAYLLGRNSFFELGDVSTSFYAEIDSPDFQLDRAERALRRLIERHEMLRVIVLPDGRQRILPEVPEYEIEVTDLSALPDQAAEAEALACRERLSRETRASDRWPLFDVRAIRLPGGVTRLCVAIDLLIIDGGSLRVFIDEWGRLYDDPEVRLPVIDVSFRDYVLAVAEIERSDAYRRAREYWLGRLPDLPRAPDLPLVTRPEPPAGRPRYRRRTARLRPSTWRRLKARAARAGLTASMLLCAAYAEVLGTWSRSRRFTFSVTIGDRLPLHPRIHEIMGNFTSVNLLEVDGTAAGGFEARALALQRQMAADLEHRLFGGVRVMRELARQGGRAQASVPVVFTSVIDQGGFDADAATSSLGTVTHSLLQTPQVYLENQVYEAGGGLQANWDAVEELFPEGLLDEMFGAYRGLLERLA